MKCSLRSLFVFVTLAALAMGWWNYRRDCLRRADKCFESSANFMLLATVAGGHSGLSLAEHEQRQRDADVAKFLRLSHLAGQEAQNYRRAIWCPWLRLTMESLPEETP